MLKYSSVFQCTSCESFYLQPFGRLGGKEGKATKVSTPRVVVPASCNSCGGDFTIGGPIWSAKMHDNAFVERLLESIKDKDNVLGTKKRIQGLL